jgi:hypothetical protein
MEQAGLPFRATRDLDIVLIAETLDSGFARSFWDFVRAGRYSVAQSSKGRPTYYRFVSPQVPGFPSMLEILSIRPDQLELAGDVHLTPVPLKARAWLDLKQRRDAGHKIHNRDVSKHRKDVFRLYRIIDPAPRGDVPPIIQADMGRFLNEARREPIDLRSMGIAQSSFNDVLERLGRIYGAGQGAAERRRFAARLTSTGSPGRPREHERAEVLSPSSPRGLFGT